MVLEYGAEVDATALATDDFRVEDSVYNFRFHGSSACPSSSTGRSRTCGRPTTRRACSRGRPVAAGRYVVLELADSPDGGWTVIVSRCPTFRAPCGSTPTSSRR